MDKWNYIVDLFTILTPIVVAVFSYIYSKKLEEKNSKDIMITRLATFYSCINFAHNEKSIIKWDWSYLKNLDPYTNSHNILKVTGSSLKEFGHAFSITMFFKSITTIMPTQVLVTKLTFCTSIYDATNEREKLEYLTFENGDNEYKSVSIKDTDIIGIPILCFISNGENEKLKNISKDNQKIIATVSMKIKNQFNVITECELVCSYIHNFIDTETGELSLKDGNIKILNTYE